MYVNRQPLGVVNSNTAEEGAARLDAMKSLGTNEQAFIENLISSSSAASTMFNKPTVVGVANFNAAEDAAALLGAMKSFGTNEQAIIEILTSRSNAQRQAIAQAFKHEYGRDIIEDLKSGLGGNFEDVIVALMRPPAEYLCKELHNCMDDKGENEHAGDMIEILCTRTNKEIAEIVDAYERLYNTPLAEHISSSTTEIVKELFTLIVTGERNEEAGVDQEVAESDAWELYHAGHSNKWGIDAGTYYQVMGTQGFAQLRATFELYKVIAGHTVEQFLKAKFEEDQDAFIAIVEFTQNSSAWFATRLRAAMQGPGTDDRTLIRIVVSRSELDLRSIAAEYERLYDKTLESDIRQDKVSGDYKRALVALIEPAMQCASAGECETEAVRARLDGSVKLN